MRAYSPAVPQARNWLCSAVGNFETWHMVSPQDVMTLAAAAVAILITFSMPALYTYGKRTWVRCVALIASFCSTVWVH